NNRESEQRGFERSGLIAKHDSMVAGRYLHGTKVGKYTHHGRSLRSDGGSQAGEVSDFDQRVAETQRVDPGAVNLTILAFRALRTARRQIVRRTRHLIESGKYGNAVHAFIQRHHRTGTQHRAAQPVGVGIERERYRTVVARADVNQAEVSFGRGLVHAKIAS